VSVTEEALALAFRTGMPFVGLRDHAHDPDLDRLIPPDAARTARAVPLSADDDRIRLAVADPHTDLSTLDRYVIGRQVELALAPREELDTILGLPPPPGEAPTEAPTDEREPEATEQQPDPLAEAEPESLGTEETTQTTLPAAVAEPDSLAAEHPAPNDPATAEPDRLAAEHSPPRDPAPPAEPDLLAAEHPPPRDPAPPAEPDLLAAEEPAPTDAAADEPRSLVADPEAQVVAEVDAELAGEVPSWLEPRPGRWWRVVFTVLLVLVVLGAAAVLVLAFANA
jgi:hypothetical protein